MKGLLIKMNNNMKKKKKKKKNNNSLYLKSYFKNQSL